jgi:hypothetical protein
VTAHNKWKSGCIGIRGGKRGLGPTAAAEAGRRRPSDVLVVGIRDYRYVDVSYCPPLLYKFEKSRLFFLLSTPNSSGV